VRSSNRAQRMKRRRRPVRPPCRRRARARPPPGLRRQNSSRTRRWALARSPLHLQAVPGRNVQVRCAWTDKCVRQGRPGGAVHQARGSAGRRRGAEQSSVVLTHPVPAADGERNRAGRRVEAQAGGRVGHRRDRERYLTGGVARVQSGCGHHRKQQRSTVLIQPGTYREPSAPRRWDLIGTCLMRGSRRR
jgi:hypothetical protein